MPIVRKLDLHDVPGGDDRRICREWLVTNGIGGYASGSFEGRPTRRFHGLLVAALPAPLGRVLMLSHAEVTARLPDRSIVSLSGAALVEVRLEDGLPVWRYAAGGHVIEQRVVLVHGRNTTHLSYTLVEGPDPVRLQMRPFMCFRAHEGRVDGQCEAHRVQALGERIEISGPAAVPPLRLHTHGARASFTIQSKWMKVELAIEQHRGYDFAGTLHSPGYARADLTTSSGATFIASTESWDSMLAMTNEQATAAERERRAQLLQLAPPALKEGLAAELVLAADQFIIAPLTRREDAARAEASGDALRSVIAGYHWFTDWGRDTMISLEGLTILTGRHAEAGAILRTFAHYVRDGLVPNMFPEGQNEGLYHTADASLWFFHAMSRYLSATRDKSTLARVLPVLRQIADAHMRGTRFGIGVDSSDGLLRQGMEGYQLTWMDAKVDDWVVTPRRGKAVEINALYYNALVLLAGWLREAEGDDAAAPYLAAAEQARASFNARFWYEAGGHLYDVIDGEGGDDPACRPNQLLAISLEHPILDPARWPAVLEVCERTLLTPVGLRSLAPGHADYRSRYFGDLRTRDAAYHQGTVWAWLIGPFVDTWRKVRPHDREGMARLIDGFAEHVGEACLGSVSEVFDAEAPFTPRGCVAQAWSVAELLRCWALVH